MWIDKNPESMLLLPVADRMVQGDAVPSLGVITVLRDPRDVCLSCFFQYLPPNAVSVQFQTLRSTAEKYARTMSLWLALREKLTLPSMAIRYEDIIANPESATRSMTQFLGVPFDDTMLQLANNAKRHVVHSPTYADVSESIQSTPVGRWKDYASQFEELDSILRPFISSFGYS